MFYWANPHSHAQLLQLAGCDIFGHRSHLLYITQQAEIHKPGMFISNHIYSVIELLMITLDITREGYVRSTLVGDYIKSPKISSCYEACRLILINTFKGHPALIMQYEFLCADIVLTLPPWSRVRTRSLLTCDSAISALSSASSSSCWSFRYLVRLVFDCSSCRQRRDKESK